MTKLDIVIPVYNEGGNIIKVLDSFHTHVKTPYRVLICYDMEEDDTLAAIADYPDEKANITLVKNPGRGPNQAVVAGLEASTAPAVMVHMADDDFNGPVIDSMMALLGDDCEIVSASRFIKGGCYTGSVWYKTVLTRTASFTAYHFANLPVHDATNGFRLFSRRVLDTIKIESTDGFTFTFELLVKADRLGWKAREVPALWYERTVGSSRFRVWDWFGSYLRWYRYAFATAWLGRGSETVLLRDGVTLEDATR